jgi:hypothetical protein
MDDDLLHDVFATDNLWKPSDFTRDALSYESSLFAPLQFDGTFKRVKHALHCVDHIQSPQSSSTIRTPQRNPSIVNSSCQI